MSPPPRLYKYEAFSTQSLLNLKKQIIYFGSPLNFNDPYDCALTPNLVEPTDDEALKIRDMYLANTDMPHQARIEFETTSLANLRAVLLRTGQAGFKGIAEKFLQTRGVACFSERKDDLLMWSHYANCHKGFCVGFDRGILNETVQGSLGPVNYDIDIPKFRLFEDIPDFLVKLLGTKSKVWEYEEEYRIIKMNASKQIIKYLY